jgi:hypothetical protein
MNLQELMRCLGLIDGVEMHTGFSEDAISTAVKACRLGGGTTVDSSYTVTVPIQFGSLTNSFNLA